MALDSLAFHVILGILSYASVSVCFYLIATTTGEENAWFAFLPILNLILIVSIAGNPTWWILLLLVPFLNILITALLFLGIAEARGKSSWTGILALIPGVNLGYFGYLAFSR